MPPARECQLMGGERSVRSCAGRLQLCARIADRPLTAWVHSLSSGADYQLLTTSSAKRVALVQEIGRVRCSVKLIVCEDRLNASRFRATFRPLERSALLGGSTNTAIPARLDDQHPGGCQLCLARLHAAKVAVKFDRLHPSLNSPKCAGLPASSTIRRYR